MAILQETANFIRSHKVVDLKMLEKKFPGRSKPSFHRDLAKLGCISCYTDNSRYYTLPDIPDYDGYGLWHHGSITFSRNLTAKETVRVLVCESPSGLTHSELQDILGVRLYNPLKALVQEKAIISETDGGKLIFFSGDDAVGQKQRESRADMAAAITVHPFNLHTVIDVLLAVFLEKKETAYSAFSFLKSGKYPHISLKEVEDIFSHYKLPGKKN